MTPIERRLGAIEKALGTVSIELRAQQLAELSGEPAAVFLDELSRTSRPLSHEEWLDLLDAEERAE